MKLTDKHYVPNDFAKEGFWGFVGAIFKVIYTIEPCHESSNILQQS